MKLQSQDNEIKKERKQGLQFLFPLFMQGYVFCPPPLGGGFVSQLKTREEFEGGLHEKRKGKGGKEEKRKE